MQTAPAVKKLLEKSLQPEQSEAKGSRFPVIVANCKPNQEFISRHAVYQVIDDKHLSHRGLRLGDALCVVLRDRLIRLQEILLVDDAKE